MTEPSQQIGAEDAPLGSVVQFTEEEIDRRIAAAIAATRAEIDRQHQTDMAEMETRHSAELEAVRKSFQGAFPDTQIPAHAGGPGTVIAQTWSLQDQELARQGIHPLQASKAA